MDKSLQAAVTLLKLHHDSRPSGLILTKAGADELAEQIGRVEPVTMTSPWTIGSGLDVIVDYLMPENCAGIVVNGEKFFGTLKKEET